MDFHALSRRDLQALAKRNGIRANLSNVAMADALAALPAVDGIEEYVQQPVAEPTPAAEPEVQAAAEVEKKPAAEEEEETEKQKISPNEVIVLDDSEEEEKDLTADQDEEKAPALGVGLRRATQRTRVEPVAAPATRRRAAASKADKAYAAVEAVPARATRGRSQRTVAEDEAPKAQRTSRRAVAKKTSTEQDDEEKGTQGDVSSDEGGDGAAQKEEQNAPVKEQSQEDEGETVKEDAAAEAVPARATRARSQKEEVSAAAEEAPKARRTSRKTDTEQQEEEKCAQEMEAATDAQNEEQFAAAEAERGDGARTTRSRRQRMVVSASEEEATKARRASRRAAARKTSIEKKEEEKGTQGDVSDVEAAVPAPASSDEGDDGAEEIEAAMDAQNEEQFAAVEAVPARTTRARRQRTVVSAAEEEAPKARRTSRRTAARKTSTETEEEEKATQGVVSDVEDAVPAPVSSNEGSDGAEEMEAAMDAQNEEQVEVQSQEEEGVVADTLAPVEEPAAAEDCMVDPSVEEKLIDVQQCEDSPVALAVAEQEGSGTFQNDAVSSEGIHHASEDTEMVPVDEVLQTPLKSGEATEEVSFTSNVGHASEEIETPASEEVIQTEDKAIDEQEDIAADVVTDNTDASVEDMAGHTSEEDEDCTAEEESPVAEDVDSSVQEPLVHVQQCEEIHLAGEDAEMVPVNELQQAMMESGEATEEVDSASDVGEENEDCTVEEEPPLADDVDSSVQEPLVDVQHCEATKDIHFASEDAEMVPEVQQAMLESSEATEEVASDVSEENEDCTVEGEPPVADDDDVSVQEPLVDVQQCESTEEIHLATEDTEMVPLLKSGEATEEVDFTEIEAPTSGEILQNAAKAVEENEVPTSGEVLQSAAKAVEENEDMAADEVQHNTDEYVEEEAVVATEEMPQISEAMDEGVVEVAAVDNLSQATVTDEGAVKESGFSCDLADVVSVEEKGVVTADAMPQSSATMENVEEVVTVDNLSQATVTDDEGAVKESGFTGELMDVPAEEEGVVAAEMPHSSATMDDVVQEVITVANLSQATVSSATMDDVVQEVITVDNLSKATVTNEEGAVKESVFSCGLSVLAVDEEGVMAADEMQLSSASMNRSVEEVVTVDNLSQATVTDDEWAAKESAFTGECTPVVDAARDFSDHIASPFSANVFEYATKSLSMDSITVETTASEPADVPLCMYSSSGKKSASEPVAVQQENEVKKGNEPEAAFGRIVHSPLTIRKLRMAVAQENEADDVPLCIFGSGSGKKNASEPVAVQPENEVKEGNKPEAAFGRIIHSPLTIRKLRMAVAQEIKADDVPLCIFSSSGGEENSAEPVMVEREKEVNEYKALGSLSRRKLRTNLNEKVAVAQENEVREGEKSSPPLDKLSLRKLRLKLKETLTAQKNMEPKRVALGRLDENAC